MATYIKTSIKTCEVCLKSFSRPSRRGFKAWSRAKFCGLDCRAKRVLSPEHKKAIIAGLNKNPHRYQKGIKPWNWIEDRSKVVKNEKKHLDSNYKLWMRQVKNRDYWKCQISNDDCSGRVEAHHILSWSENPELRYEVRNGITLCHFHHPRGRKAEEEMRQALEEIVARKAQ